MASKREMRRRLTLVKEDLRGLRAAIDDNNWELAMEWIDDVRGDVEVVAEYVQDRIDGQEEEDDASGDPTG